MLRQLTAGLLMALISFSTISSTDASAAAIQGKTAAHKAAKKPVRKRIAYRSGKSYLIPPPPPYAPSILPELAYARARGHRRAKHEPIQVEKVESHYSKVGVQAVEGYEDPEPVKTNKYVTYWNKS
ncbi:MAG: hypothetical protein K2X93_22800 [Candidatus Obscuribacterales bacterium]|nr:hypothetical protein [Candidatus Obscuribacterales bacterium]